MKTKTEKNLNRELLQSAIISNSILEPFISKSHDSLLRGSGNMTLAALEYLKQRGMTEKTIIDNKIGYVGKYDKIPEEILHYGNDLLPIPKDEDEKPRNLFWFLLNKIIVPVYDEFGYVVGLATRTPSFEKGNSWWNMPAPFYKGQHLYLLDKCKKAIFEKNKVYLVEGYMDALILNQYGIDNCVAVMGTALTLRKIGLIARYCNRVCLCFDVDKNNAGQNAKDSAVAQLNKLVFCDEISVLDNLPVGVDPDDFVIKNGVDEFYKHEKVLNSNEIEKVLESIKDLKKQRKEDAKIAREEKIKENVKLREEQRIEAERKKILIPK